MRAQGLFERLDRLRHAGGVDLFLAQQREGDGGPACREEGAMVDGRVFRARPEAEAIGACRRRGLGSQRPSARRSATVSACGTGQFGDQVVACLTASFERL
jgi:hypothetical protein